MANTADCPPGRPEPFWVIRGREFDLPEPVLLILPLWLEIIFTLCCHTRQNLPIVQEFWLQRLAVQGRYNVSVFLSILTGSLQGIAERPLPCICNRIQRGIALSRR